MSSAINKILFGSGLTATAGLAAFRSGFFGEEDYRWPSGVPRDASIQLHRGMFFDEIHHGWYSSEEEARYRAMDPFVDDYPYCPWYHSKLVYSFKPVSPLSIAFWQRPRRTTFD
jgi:hypothetical protein